MAINPVPKTTGDGRLEDKELAEKKEDYDHLSEPQVSVWEESLQKSISIREAEQASIVKKTGGQKAHEERLENDPKYREAWEGHEKRIRKEETAFNAAGEWLKNPPK